MSTIAELSKEIHENAKSKGFWDKDRNIGEMLMLIVSEVSEALEADRENKYSDNRYLEKLESDGYTWEDSAISFASGFKRDIKNSFADELADVMIRVMDLAYSKGINLEWHIKHKMAYNATRPHMHGKKY